MPRRKKSDINAAAESLDHKDTELIIPEKKKKVVKKSTALGLPKQKISANLKVVSAEPDKIVFEDKNNNVVIWKASNYDGDKFKIGNNINATLKIKEIVEDKKGVVTITNYLI